MNSVSDVIKRCLSLGDEHEWFEFKDSLFNADEIGEYMSALSNAAVMAEEPYGYLIWGIDNKTHEFTNTKFNYQKDYKQEPFQHYLSRNVNPSIFYQFDEELIDGKRVVVLSIPAARIVPTAYKDERYIRVGSSKEKIKKHPEREAALFRILNFGPRNLVNTESYYNELTFDQLFLYYEAKGIKLKKSTFKKNLGLLTPSGRYNLLAQLLSDDPHIPIRFALFAGTDKTSTMYAVKEFGHMCLLVALDKVIDYGDTLNIPQADERNRKVERKEVMLFDMDAFREAVINAFQHNLWVNGASPMFTAFQDRIEITSIGTMPADQTKEGFYAGVSVPVDVKLTEVFLQLHISEKSGRGVPRIIKAYGKEAFKFSDNAITVTIPFNRLNLGDTPHDTPHDAPHDGSIVKGGPQQKIIDFCAEAHSREEIANMLGYTDRKTVNKHLNDLIEQGRLARTIPDKPKSKNQKYITIK